MAGEEQERFEDYLELERYIEDLQAGRPARLPHDLTPEQARVYRMVSVFRSAASENGQNPQSQAAEPRPAFVADLYRHLQNLAQAEEEIAANANTNPALPIANQPTTRLDDQNTQSTQPAQQLPTESTTTPTPNSSAGPGAKPAEQEGQRQDADAQRQRRGTGRKRIVSRRALFTGGAVAAAALVGAEGSMIVAQLTMEPKREWPNTLVTASTPVEWYKVMPAANLGEQAVKFVAETVVGYVIYNDDEKKILAFSAACTHMGCIVQWNGQARRFDCPCHNGRFDEYGQPDPNSPIKYLLALPGLPVRVDEDDGYVYVAVPKKTSA